MTNGKKLVWIIGNLLLGIGTFYAYLRGLLQAWGQDPMWIYPVISVSIVLLVFTIFNLIIILSDKAKHWGLSLAIMVGAAVGTLLVHAILQNTILE